MDIIQKWIVIVQEVDIDKVFFKRRWEMVNSNIIAIKFNINSKDEFKIHIANIEKCGGIIIKAKSADIWGIVQFCVENVSCFEEEFLKNDSFNKARMFKKLF